MSEGVPEGATLPEGIEVDDARLTSVLSIHRMSFNK